MYFFLAKHISLFYVTSFLRERKDIYLSLYNKKEYFWKLFREIREIQYYIYKQFIFSIIFLNLK